MGPEEEHTGQEVGVFLKAGRVDVFTIDFELNLGLRFFLLHQWFYSKSIRLKFFIHSFSDHFNLSFKHIIF